MNKALNIKLVISILMLFTLLSNRGYSQTDSNFKNASDSIMNNLYKPELTFIYLFRYVSATNRNTYILFSDSANNNCMYKINSYGIFKYCNNIGWRINSFKYIDDNTEGNLNEESKGLMKAILLDSVVVGNTFISHSPRFLIKWKNDLGHFEIGGEYRHLETGQPIEQFLISIERDILNAEQSRTNWNRLR